MKNEACPISFEKIDATLVRVLSACSGILFLLFVKTQFLPIILFLFVDFVLRIFIKKEYSPLFRLAQVLKDLLKLESHLMDNAPKRLASYFSLSFVILTGVTSYLGLETIFYALSAIYGVCIFLEVAFDYCLGCKIYYLYMKFFG